MSSASLQLSTRLNLQQVHVMGHAPLELVQECIEEIAAFSEPPTATALTQILICRVIHRYCKIPYQRGVGIVAMMPKLSESVQDDLKYCIGHLAYLRAISRSVTVSEFSTELLNIKTSRGGWADISTLGLLVEPKVLSQKDPEIHQFILRAVQNFMAAFFLHNQPFIITQNFIFHHLLSKNKVSPDHEDVVQFYCGLSTKGMPITAPPLVRYIISYLCQTVDGSLPVCDNDIVLLAFSCIFEAQIPNCALMVDQELLTSRTFAFSSEKVKKRADALAYYLKQTQNSWKVYSKDPAAKELQKSLMALGGFIPHKAPSPMPHGVVIISTKEFEEVKDLAQALEVEADNSQAEDYLTSPLQSYTYLSAKQLEVGTPVPSTTELDCIPAPVTVSQSSSLSAFNCVPRQTYGYLSVQDYECRHQFQQQCYYKMMKDVFAVSLQPNCLTFIESQYRKNDHLWFSLSRNMRTTFYESVQISPIIPLHWVKVKQPTGSQELEEKMKQQALEQNKSSSSEMAELVVLNSHRPILIEVSSSTSEQPLVISLDRDSGSADPGEIGCDCFMKVHTAQHAITTNVKQFDVKEDRCIPRQLPLPPKKQEEPDATETTALQPAPVLQETKRPPATAHLPHQRVTGSTLPTIPSLFSSSSENEQVLKKSALDGFDRPGYCFYVDHDYSFQLRFSRGEEYTLPEKMLGARVLREGGNGLILEVTVQGHLYAVKKTALRWREVVIMPKLKHPNILRVMAMFVGTPMPEYPRRRFMYQFYPRMKGDLGRMVGSYEKYCLRTLNQRYKEEPLLLSTVMSNFQHVARALLQALDYLHNLQPNCIVHRDVKPSNVLVDMPCDCPNPLVCVCRNKPVLVLSDFDASMELTRDGKLQPDPSRPTMFGLASSSKVYHVSPVGTIGFKSPEGFLHCVGNDLEVMPPVSPKMDIFSFGLLMLLLLLNEEGPRHLQQMGTLLLSLNQTTVKPHQSLSAEKKAILRKNNIFVFRPAELFVGTKDLNCILPLQRIHSEFSSKHNSLCDFMDQCLKVDTKERYSAVQLLHHQFLIDSTV